MSIEEDKEYCAVSIKANLEDSAEKNYLVSENVYKWLNEYKNIGGFKRYRIDLYSDIIKEDEFKFSGKNFIKTSSEKIREDFKKEWDIDMPENQFGVWRAEIEKGKIVYRNYEDENYDALETSSCMKTMVSLRWEQHFLSKEDAVIETPKFLDYLRELGVNNEQEHSIFYKQYKEELEKLDIKEMKCFKLVELDGIRLKDVLYNDNRLKEHFNKEVNLGDIRHVAKSSYEDRNGKEIYVLENMNYFGMFSERPNEIRKNKVMYFKEDFNLSSALYFVSEYEKDQKLKRTKEKENKKENTNSR